MPYQINHQSPDFGLRPLVFADRPVSVTRVHVGYCERVSCVSGLRRPLSHSSVEEEEGWNYVWFRLLYDKGQGK